MNERRKSSEMCASCPNRGKISELLAKVGLVEVNLGCPGPDYVEYFREEVKRETDEQQLVARYGQEWTEQYKKMIYEIIGPLRDNFDPFTKSTVTRELKRVHSKYLCHGEKEKIQLKDDEKVADTITNDKGQRWHRVEKGPFEMPLNFSLD